MKQLFAKIKDALLLVSDRTYLIIIASLVIISVILATRQNSKSAENIRLYGVVVKAIVYEIGYAKGTATYGVNFLYKKKNYYNYCRSNHRSFIVGDSIKIKINSKDPTSHCEIAQ